LRRRLAIAPYCRAVALVAEGFAQGTVWHQPPTPAGTFPRRRDHRHHAFTFVDTVVFWVGEENWRSELGSVGLMSGSVSQLLGFGIQNQVFDWRIVAALAVACAIGGIVSLYMAAFVLKYCGRMLGGRTSAADLRTVVAGA
jgi:hypothetical protein